MVLMFASVNALTFKSHTAMKQRTKISHGRSSLSAVMPGDPMVSYVVFQGVSNAIKLYSTIIFARIALTWFPQLPRQFPILRPVFTVTEPYLKFFRKQIPAIGGFDISTIPAIFALDILSQATAAMGSDFPDHLSSSM